MNILRVGLIEQKFILPEFSMALGQMKRCLKDGGVRWFFFFFQINVQGSFGGPHGRGIWKDWVLSGIGVHGVKFRRISRNRVGEIAQ